MAREGLIAVSKLVERLGKSHEQRYWVKPSDLRELVRKDKDPSSPLEGGGTQKAIEKVGGDYWRAKFLVAGWKASAGTTDTAKMRAAAAKAVHASNPAAIQKELERSTRAATNVFYSGEKEQAGVRGSEPEHVQAVSQAFQQGLEDEGVRADIAAMAAVSQSMYDEPEVYVWRGVRSNSSGARLYDEAYELVQQDPEAELTIEMGVLSSFTDDPGVAKVVAGLSSALGSGMEGYYFRVKVPRDSIVMSHRVDRLDPGLKGEKEVTLLTNGSLKVKARDFVHAGDKPGSGLDLLAQKAEKDPAFREAAIARAETRAKRSLEEFQAKGTRRGQYQ